MHRRSYERMEQEIRAIHRALTGEDPPIDAEAREDEPRDAGAPSEVDVERRFTELAIVARSIPEIAAELSVIERAPAVDVLEDDDEVLVEALLPGVAKQDVDVHVVENALFLAASAHVARAADGHGRVYVHAEIPRGPFRRVVPLPCGVRSEPRVEIDHGLVRIHLRKAPSARADRRDDAQAAEE